MKILLTFSVAILIASYSNRAKNDEISIALVSVDGVQFDDLNTVSKYLEDYYKCRIIIIPPITVPDICYRKNSNALNPTAVLRHVEDLLENNIYDKYMVVTEKPIRIGGDTKFWDENGLRRGMGAVGGDFCIISTFKLKDESNGDQNLYNKLLSQVARHEIGHNLGLDHCQTDQMCVMVGSFDDNVIQSARTTLCKTCSKKLQQYIR